MVSALAGAVAPGPKWWNASNVAVVTGANKGIGREAAQQLAEYGFTTVVTARKDKEGQQAADEIKQALVTSGVKSPEDLVAFHPLDITDQKSIEALRNWVQQKYGGLTVLVNNAGIASKGNVFGPEECRITIATNYSATAAVTEALLPLMPQDGTGRVVTVASRSGMSSIVKTPQLRDRFLNASSKADVDKLVEEFLAIVSAGDDAAMASKGWPRSMYGVSKLALNAYCRAKAKEVTSSRIMINTCCPGYCCTDMSSRRGPKSAWDGAKVVTWLSTKNPQDWSTGGFWVYDTDCTEIKF